jgi:transcription initiation factor TFIIB
MTGDDTPDRETPTRGTENGTNPTQKTRLSERLDVSEEVLDEALDLYQKVQEADTRGHPVEAIPIAVIYIAIRQQGVARNIEEVAEAADVSAPELYRTARFVGDILHQGIPPAEPELYVGRLADETGLSTDTEEFALDIISKSKSEGYHSGRNPEGLAAAALYTAIVEGDVDEDVTQRELSDATNVNTVTIRRNYQQLSELFVDGDD